MNEREKFSWLVAFVLVGGLFLAWLFMPQ